MDNLDAAIAEAEAATTPPSRRPSRPHLRDQIAAAARRLGGAIDPFVFRLAIRSGGVRRLFVAWSVTPALVPG